MPGHAARPPAGEPAGLFIAGMLRSGTTLLDKLLNSHPRLTVASQPFFSFYAGVKAAYLGPDSARPFPLTPGFMEPMPAQGAFDAWLARTTLEGSLLGELERSCTGAKGQGSAALRGRVTGLVPGSCYDVWRQLHRAVAATYGDPGAGGYVGSKEVLCEEFLPYLAGAGVRCIVVLRDPRAVIASLHNGAYRAAVGDVYPILLSLRNWRKSAAYFLRARSQPNLLALRYEDLTLDGPGTLDAIARFLGVEPFEPAWYADGLKDQDGEVWRGNSSFKPMDKVQARGAEHWRQTLDPETIRFIEFCAYPELCALGYPVAADAWEPAALQGYREDTSQLRQGYLRDYGLNPANLAGELARREQLLSAAAPDDAGRHSLFLLDEAYRALKTAVGPVGS